MCGICGYIDIGGGQRAELGVLVRMMNTIAHRGPDSSGYFLKENIGLGFRRLSLIDLEGGDQPLYNEDRSIVLLCNGEIFNYLELKRNLIQKGHVFRTNSDVEVIIHLYEDYQLEFLNQLNGQFAFVLYDEKAQTMVLARDQFGICPLYYTHMNDTFIFASEIKAILAYPSVPCEVDLIGLDQVITFPGLISPRTMFKNIKSLQSGHYILLRKGDMKIKEYWDLSYPRVDEIRYDKPERYYVENLERLLTQAVKYRLHADVDVGLYLSGGLDSSLIVALARRLEPSRKRHSFSISFIDKSICESTYHKLMAKYVDFTHHELLFDWPQISDRLQSIVYYSECPIKETYNTASIALSKAAKEQGISAILTGEGADELFAGYVSYRFDQFRHKNKGKRSQEYDFETMLEDELRSRLWGDEDLFYERDFYSFRDTKLALYSSKANELLNDFDCLNFDLVSKERLQGRHYLHQRSYLDFKLRLSDHLLSDHGDRMALANAVEARYPFLDINLVEFTREIPPDLKLNEFTEKYILKKLAQHLLPPEIVKREKYAFHAPGSPYLLKQNVDWIHDLLSPGLLEKQGYFNPHTIERLKRQYMQDGFELHLPFESDLLIIVLTFGIFLEVFKMPYLS